MGGENSWSSPGAHAHTHGARFPAPPREAHEVPWAPLLLGSAPQMPSWGPSVVCPSLMCPLGAARCPRPPCSPSPGDPLACPCRRLTGNISVGVASTGAQGLSLCPTPGNGDFCFLKRAVQCTWHTHRHPRRGGGGPSAPSSSCKMEPPPLRTNVAWSRGCRWWGVTPEWLLPDA